MSRYSHSLTGYSVTSSHDLVTVLMEPLVAG